MLVRGNAQERIRTHDVRALACSDHLKEIVHRCIGERRKRYESADEMIEALRNPPADLKSGVLRTLKGASRVYRHPHRTAAGCDRAARRAGPSSTACRRFGRRSSFAAGRTCSRPPAVTVERHRHCPKAHQRAQGQDVLDAVLAEQRDVIAGLNPLLPEAGGGVVDGVIEFPETPALVAKDEGHSLRGKIGPAAQPLGQGLARRTAPSIRRPGRRPGSAPHGHHSRLAAKSSPKRR